VKTFRKVAIIGCGMTKFGSNLNKSLAALLVEASRNAINDSNLGEEEVQAVFVASMLSGELANQTAIASAVTDALGLLPAAADRVENGPASGGSAVKNACLSIASGVYDFVLVTGGEKMSHVPGDEVTDRLATMTHPSAEYMHGVTLPSLAGMFTRLYMNKYGVERKHLAMVAVKNHANALKNPYAHLQRAITIEGIFSAPEAEVNNPLISDPLRLFDCCPMSDGAASILLGSAEKVREICKTPIVIAGLGHATDTLAVHEREDVTVLKAVRESSKQAFSMAKLTPKDVDVAELHDAFTILEIAESEDAGFFEKGTGHEALEEGITSLDGKLPINPSGGLKARGHPVGATGVAQICELTWQLRGEAGKRQVTEAQRAYSCNFGGFGNNVVSFVLTSGE
jgi:acetyl-CoA C-acetyltransferase